MPESALCFLFNVSRLATHWQGNTKHINIGTAALHRSRKREGDGERKDRSESQVSAGAGCTIRVQGIRLDYVPGKIGIVFVWIPGIDFHCLFTGDHSNQDPRCTQKPIYKTIFVHHIWS